MELALGTVQFGLPYGIAGRGAPVPETEVRQILQIAHAGGIRLLDTAAAYGSIEERLPALCGSLQFRVVSKIPALPGGAELGTVEKFVADAVHSVGHRLGDALYALLFHRAADLLGPAADSAWRAALDAARPRGVQLGVSVYAPDEARAVQKRFAIDLNFNPSNFIDRFVGEGYNLNTSLRYRFTNPLIYLLNIVKRFHDHTTKLFEKHGIENIAYFSSDANDGKQPFLVYMIANKDEAEHKKEWDEFRTDPEWIKVKDDSEKDGKIVEKVESVFLKPLSFSKIK